MKTLIPASTFFFFSFFLLYVFTSNLPSTAADVITDRDGDAFQNGETYHILPLFGVRDDGVELAATGNETCPLTVVQSRTSQIFRGLPVRISSPLRITYITEGLIPSLAFTSWPSCAPTPPKWTVVNDLLEGQAVKLPGYSNTVSGWFKIKRSSLKYSYKVVFCAGSGGTCGEVGINVDDEGMSRLVVTDDEGMSRLVVTDDEGNIVEFMKASPVGV